MLGDFNLPSVHWSLNRALSDSSVLDNQFVDFFFVSRGLVQMVQVPTYFPSANVLDLLLCSHEERVGLWEVFRPLAA